MGEGNRRSPAKDQMTVKRARAAGQLFSVPLRKWSESFPSKKKTMAKKDPIATRMKKKSTFSRQWGHQMDDEYPPPTSFQSVVMVGPVTTPERWWVGNWATTAAAKSQSTTPWQFHSLQCCIYFSFFFFFLSHSAVIAGGSLNLKVKKKGPQGLKRCRE